MPTRWGGKVCVHGVLFQCVCVCGVAYLVCVREGMRVANKLALGHSLWMPAACPQAHGALGQPGHPVKSTF